MILIYKILSTVSAGLRLYYLPNPFERYFKVLLKDTDYVTMASLCANIFNVLIGSIVLHKICFKLTGIVYNKGEAPALGALIYLLLMFFNSWVLVWISLCGLSVLLSMVLFILSIIFEIIILLLIKNRVYSVY